MKEKLIKRNFMIILIVGILLIIGGISALNEIRTAPSGYFLTEDVAEINEENETIGTVLLFVGVGLCVVSFIYKNSAKARLLAIDKEHTKTKGNSVDKIKELKKLYDEKVITKEEYEKKKKELLDEI